MAEIQFVFVPGKHYIYTLIVDSSIQPTTIAATFRLYNGS